MLAHSFEGKRLTGPNDVVVKSQQADKCIPAFEAVTQLASTNMVTIRLLPILAIPWAFSPRDGIICSEGAMKANWITASFAGKAIRWRFYQGRVGRAAGGQLAMTVGVGGAT